MTHLYLQWHENDDDVIHHISTFLLHPPKNVENKRERARVVRTLRSEQKGSRQSRAGKREETETEKQKSLSSDDC